jgi:hypothetical protein
MIRKLCHNELSILKSIYYNEIDYETIKITTDHIFSKLLKKYSAIVFDNTIVFTKKSYKEDFSLNLNSMALLVHEVCHVWQFQNLNYRWYKAGIEHLKFGKSTYIYSIANKTKLTDFRFEQQGEIVADYFKLRESKSNSVNEYEKVIYSVIRRS